MTLVTAKIISKQYGIPLPTVYYYIRNGTLPAVRVSGRWKFDQQKVEKLLKLGENDCARTWQGI